MNTTGYTGQSLADVANLRQEISDATWRTEPPTSAGQAVVLRADSNGDGRGGSGPPGGRVDELWLAVVYRCWQREHHGDVRSVPGTSTKTIASRSPTGSPRA